ncbi:MAG: transporter substrate-binding domain-containing protein, partial [Spirochaetales bacterium]|nr:transporter substrate-binding domain-containing protein [Spirochaetales bacterium]
DADIIEIILKELEIEAVYFQGDFDDVLAQYKFGNSLNLLTGVEITENRKLFTDFTQPIYYRHSTLFVLDDSSFGSVEDLNNLIIAGDRDSFIENLIKRDYSSIKLRIIHTDTKKDSILMLQEGTVQAIIMPEIVALSLSKKLNVKIRPILEDINGVPVAIAVKKDYAQLKDILNEEISILKSNGTIDRLIKKWTE